VQQEQAADMLSLSRYGGEPEGVKFEELASSLQDALYDLLDELELDDRLAQSVQQHVEIQKAKEDIDHLARLRTFLD
jgi:hypothetical protein